MLLINRGIVCRHFFAVMLFTQSACFHLGLISKRWFKESNYTKIAKALDSMPAFYISSNSDELQESSTNNNSFDHLTTLRRNDVFVEPLRQVVDKRYR
jgi:hypothetical protein